MEFWIPFWTWVLLISLSVFAIVTVVVVIGGLWDIRSLFRSLARQHRSQGVERGDETEGMETGHPGRSRDEDTPVSSRTEEI